MTQPIRPDSWLWHSAVCIVLSGFTIVGVSSLTPLPIALAQTAGPTASSPQARQPRAAIAITSAQDAVDKFNAAHQLYIKGEPLPPAQVEQLQTILQQHPNIYVVLMDTTSDVVAADQILSRGIGNSEAFQTVRNPQLGEREGVLFMVYFDSDQGRKIYMRAEALPDQLGVGEEHFADSSGNPRELLGLFVNAVQNEGKEVPGALEVVIQRINDTIQRHVQQTVGQAEQMIQEAETRLAGFSTTFEPFRAQHSVGGELGNPNTAAWTQQLTDAKAALSDRQFGEAKRLAELVLRQVQTHEQAMSQYDQAPAVVQILTETLETVQTDLSTLQENQHTQQAAQHYAEARQSLEVHQIRYQEGRLDFWQPLEAAQQFSEQASEAVVASRRLQANRETFSLVAIALILLAVGGTGFFANRRASRYRKQAGQELAAARAEIGAKTKELIALMDEADYAALANYTGTTDQMAQTLMARLTDALMLVGGAEKFMAEAEALIQGHRLTNLFLTVNYKRAIALLTDPETQLTFGLQDSTRTALIRGSSAESWRQTLLNQDTSRLISKSLKDVLLAMADNRDAATELLQEITSKDHTIAQYLTQVETEAKALKPQIQVLQEQVELDLIDGSGNGSGHSGERTAQQPAYPSSQTSAIPSAPVFQLEAVTDNLLPMILADPDKGGLVARGREMMQCDPVRAWDEVGDLAHRMTQDAAAIVAVAQYARANLVPTLHQARHALEPYHVYTAWAYEEQHRLSEDLEAIANTAIRVPIAERLQQTKQAIAALEVRIHQAVSQDQQRREVCPPLIAAATRAVAQARQEIHDALKRAGVFTQGTVQQVLREPEHDPSESIAAAQTHLEAIQPCLSRGDTDTAESHLTQIKTLTQDAHDLIEATRTALKDYAATLQERQQRTHAIRASIDSIYRPTLARIQGTYDAEVLMLVAPEVNAGTTIADNIDLAQNLLLKVDALTQSAQTHYQKAYLLTSSALLNEADRVLNGAQHQLDAIATAETRLDQHQQQVAADLTALTEALKQLQTSAQAVYVRPPSLQRVEQTVAAFSKAQTQVHQQPYHPYRSQTLLTETEQSRTEAEQAIATDQQAYEEAIAAIRSAERAIALAQADVQSARRKHFAHARVYTGSAESCLTEAHRQQRRAQDYLGDRAYEDIQRLARQVISSAQAASREADKAVAQARQQHQAEVSRRTAASHSSFSSPRSSSSFRSSSSSRSRSSGSSGSRGGGWGGGGSGSSGGSW